MSIEDYEFSDSDLSVYDSDGEIVYMENLCHIVQVEREDVIALAKHFKLTEEDLK